MERAMVGLRVLRRPTRLAFPRQYHPPASRVIPPLEGRQIGAREEAHRAYTILNQPYRCGFSTNRLNRVDKSVGRIS